jgi:hypothetical protein
MHWCVYVVETFIHEPHFGWKVNSLVTKWKFTGIFSHTKGHKSALIYVANFSSVTITVLES